MNDRPCLRVGRARCTVVLALVAGAWLGLLGIAVGEQCTPWELISPHPHGRNLTDVVWGGDRFVAVGYSVTQWSADGEAWQVAVHDGVHLNAVAWDGAAFVAVGDGGAILRSPDGADWDRVPSPTPVDLTGVAWGNGTYLAVAADGTAFGSITGLTWEPVLIPAPRGALRGVVFGEGVFCIFGDSSTLLLGSANGWTDVSRTGAGSKLTSVAILGGRVYVGNAYDTTGVDWIVDHGVWTEVKSPAGSFLGREESELFIVGTYDSGFRQIYSSLDGTTWTQQPIPDGPFTVRALAVGGNRAVAVGDYGLQLLRDESGVWALTSGSAGMSYDIASNGQILVLGTKAYLPDTCSIYSSTDGRTWTCRRPDARRGESVTRVVWQEDRFVAILELHRFTWSLDGMTWMPPVETPEFPFGWEYVTDIVRFRGRYLAFLGFEPPCPVTCDGGDARIIASSDLEGWEEVWDGSASQGLPRVASNGSRLVATLCCKGEGYDWSELKGFVTSEDGVTWTPVSITEPLPPTTTIVWTGTRFVAAGGGTVMQSPDGLQWEVLSRQTISFHNLSWTGDGFLAAGMWGEHPLVASSHDGILWDRSYPLLQPRRAPRLPAFYGLQNSSIQVAAGTPRIQVAAGANGTLLRRECAPEPVPVRRRLGRAGGPSQP